MEIYIFKKNQTKKIELYQNDLIFTKMWVLYQVTKRLGIHKRFQVLKCANTLKLYTSKKHYSVKIGSVSFYSFSDIQKIHHLLGCHAFGTKSLFIIFQVIWVFQT